MMATVSINIDVSDAISTLNALQRDINRAITRGIVQASREIALLLRAKVRARARQIPRRSGRLSRSVKMLRKRSGRAQYDLGVRLRDPRGSVFYGYILNAWSGKHSRWISETIESIEDDARRIVEKHVRAELAKLQ